MKRPSRAKLLDSREIGRGRYEWCFGVHSVRVWPQCGFSMYRICIDSTYRADKEIDSFLKIGIDAVIRTLMRFSLFWVTWWHKSGHVKIKKTLNSYNVVHHRELTFRVKKDMRTLDVFSQTPLDVEVKSWGKVHEEIYNASFSRKDDGKVWCFFRDHMVCSSPATQQEAMTNTAIECRNGRM